MKMLDPYTKLNPKQRIDQYNNMVDILNRSQETCKISHKNAQK